MSCWKYKLKQCALGLCKERRVKTENLKLNDTSVICLDNSVLGSKLVEDWCEISITLPLYGHCLTWVSPSLWLDAPNDFFFPPVSQSLSGCRFGLWPVGFGPWESGSGCGWGNCRNGSACLTGERACSLCLWGSLKTLLFPSMKERCSWWLIGLWNRLH
jgi:hypothetical protein